MVTPETGILVFTGTKSGKVYSLSIYSSDVIGAYVTMSTQGLAGTGSQTFWITPEEVMLTDAAIVTGQTVSTVTIPCVNDVQTGNIIAWSNIVNTLPFRNFPHITIGGGKKLTLIEA